MTSEYSNIQIIFDRDHGKQNEGWYARAIGPDGVSIDEALDFAVDATDEDLISWAVTYYAHPDGMTDDERAELRASVQVVRTDQEKKTMTHIATETELKIMTAALPAVEAVPASQDSCWPGDGPAHDDDCTETNHAASTAAVAATEGLSWEFSTWTAAAAWFRAAIEESEATEKDIVTTTVYCHGCGDEIAGISAHWHNGDGYCDGCEGAPADDSEEAI